jgi:2-(1,2-epoxy-1,2-dihydrophenyl)acetyl-CoA isomerase
MTVSIDDRIAYDLAGDVARIELAHGSGNSLDRRMGAALRAAAEQAADDAASGAARVVLVGAQGRMFSVGGDLAAFAASADRGAEIGATADGLHAGLAILRSLDVPVVSVIHGTAAGGGLGIGLVGDIVLAAAEAKLVMAYTASGLTPDCGLTWILADRLPWPRALDLTLTNRVLTGAEAAEWGLVSRAVPSDELPGVVEGVLSTLRQGASGAFANAKRLLREAGGRTLVEQLRQEAGTIARLIVEPDGVEGIDAFLGKRQPSYSSGGAP